jgi:Holliday junction resolvasome RuvABC endonuclease subunit
MDRRIAVAGIDPSLTATGYAHTDGSLNTIVYPRDCTGDQRLHYFHGWLSQILRIEQPTHVLLEDLPTHAHGAGITGMVQGVVRLALMQTGRPYTTVPAATLKKFATGRGNATKADMRMALYQRANLDIRDDNQADAAWLRYLGLYLLDMPAFTLPKTHLEPLKKLRTPDP